jgi:hypothetical protein
VWLADEPLRPTTLTIVPERVPFEPDNSAIPQLPDPPSDDTSAPLAVDDARLLRIFLRPTAAYPFPDNALVLRGALHESAAANAPAVKGARILIEWKSEAAQMGGSPTWVVSPATGATDSRGAFAAALALPPAAHPLAPTGKDISLRLRVERAGAARVSNDVDLPAGPGDPVTGRGNNLMLKDSLAWSGLTPV